jgi:hypothetical protein
VCVVGWFGSKHDRTIWLTRGPHST